MSTKYKPRLTWDVNKKVWWCEGYCNQSMCVAYWNWRFYHNSRDVFRFSPEVLKQLKEVCYGK